MTVPVQGATTPSNGAPATQQTTQSASAAGATGAQSGTTPPKAEISPEMSALMLENTKLKRKYDLKTVESAKERGKWEAEKKGLGEKLSGYDEYQQLKRLKDVDPVTVAKRLWGDKAQEILTAAWVNGGTPSAEAVALELDRRDKERDEKWNAELKRRDAEAVKEREQRSQQQLREYTAKVAASVKSSEADYPILLGIFGDEAATANALVGRIRAKYGAAAAKAKQEGGAPPQAMTWKEAADEFEAELFERFQKGALTPKYAEQLRTKLTPAPVSGGNAESKVQQPSGSQLQQSRSKTLSNDLTASTPAKRAPAVSDEERMQRARAAYEAKLTQSTHS